MGEEERIDAYLRDELDQEDRIAFEAQMVEDQDLKARVDQMTDLYSKIQSYGDAALKDDFAKIDLQDEIPASVSPKGSKSKFGIGPMIKWAIAATFLIFSTWFIWTLPFKSNTTFANLYEQHFAPFPNISKPLVRDMSTSGADRNLDLYNKKDYTTFISSLENQEILTDTMLIYLVSAQIVENRLEDAEATIVQLKSQGTSRFNQGADWYELMLALKKQDRKAAKLLVDRISLDKGHIYYERVLDIKIALEALSN